MDTSKPNIARVYDYWLGGKDNYGIDRDVAGRMMEQDPGLRDRVRDNREFVTGVARLAAERGIAQFIDLGAGLVILAAVWAARPGRFGYCRIRCRLMDTATNSSPVRVAVAAATAVAKPPQAGAA